MFINSPAEWAWGRRVSAEHYKRQTQWQPELTVVLNSSLRLKQLKRKTLSSSFCKDHSSAQQPRESHPFRGSVSDSSDGCRISTHTHAYNFRWTAQLEELDFILWSWRRFPSFFKRLLHFHSNWTLIHQHNRDQRSPTPRPLTGTGRRPSEETEEEKSILKEKT